MAAGFTIAKMRRKNWSINNDITIGSKIPDFLAPCGIDCRLCLDYKDFVDGLAQTAGRLIHLFEYYPFLTKTIQKFEKFDLKEFRKGLGWLAKQKNLCKGCRKGSLQCDSILLPGCDRNCPIRTCVQKREIELCVFCKDFPCPKSSYSKRGLPNLKRIKKLGFNNWLREQQEIVKS